MKLFFTGLKHSGKTTFAKLYAKEHGLLWADSDDLILQRIAPLSVREFYKERGKEAFMQAELSSTLDFIDTHSSFVLSLGGGAADNDELIQSASDEGFIVYLKRDERILLDRILLKNGVPPFLDPDDVEGSFHEIYLRRNEIYDEYSDLVIELGPYGDKVETFHMIDALIKEALDEQ